MGVLQGFGVIFLEGYMDQIKSQIALQLEKRAYSEFTAKTYLYWIDKLIDYQGEKSINHYTEEEIAEFLEDLKHRKRLSHSSVRQAISTMNFAFNKIGKRNFNFKSVQAGRAKKENLNTMRAGPIMIQRESMKP